MKKLHIAIFDPVGAKAGMDHYDCSLLEALQSEGLETSLYSNFQWKESDKNTCFFSSSLRRSLLNYLRFFPAFNAALHSAKRSKVDITVFHIFHFNAREAWMVRRAKRSGFRILVIVHDVESFVISPRAAALRSILLDHADYILVHNQYTLNELKKTAAQLPADKVHIIFHGHFHQLSLGQPDREQARAELGWLPGEQVVLFFGMIKKSKGLSVLLAAWNKLKPDARLVIAGRMRKHSFTTYAPMIRAIQKAGRLEARIRYITNTERDLLFRAADLVVLPYQRIYQSGVMLMAMSYGKAVLMSDLPAVKEVIDDGHNGFLFESGNSDDLVEKLNNLLTDPEKLQVAGQEAQETMKKFFGWKGIAQQVLKIISE